MKGFNIFVVILLLLSGCKQAKKQAEPMESKLAEETYSAVGAPISDDRAMAAGEMAQAYSNLQPGDTISARFEGEVLSVCQKKGCWMRLSLPEDRTVMVRFKDYGFFVPKDIAGRKVTVDGLAFVSEVDEEERRHMAEDAGQPDSLIAQIRGAERQMGFEASGVRIY